jgi:hypothetical protein
MVKSSCRTLDKSVKVIQDSIAKFFVASEVGTARILSPFLTSAEALGCPANGRAGVKPDCYSISNKPHCLFTCILFQIHRFDVGRSTDNGQNGKLFF